MPPPDVTGLVHSRQRPNMMVSGG